MKTLKAGIIGFGKMGKIRKKVLDKRPDTEVVIVCESNYKRRFKSRACLFTNDQEEVFAEDLDLLFVCTPNFLIKDLVVRALNQKIHVFAEKPPGLSYAQVEEMQQALKRNPGQKLKFGFNHRYHQAVIELKKQVDSGKFGKIIWLRGRYGKSVDETFFDNWRSKKELAGGGILMDQGIHMLDLFLHLCGDFEEVKSFCSNGYWNLDIEDNAFVIMKNSSGQQASLHSTMTQWRHLFALEVFLERGYMVINGFNTPSKTYGGECLSIALNRDEIPRATHTMEENLLYKSDHSWELEIDEFTSAVKKNSPIINGNIKDALKIMNLIERIYADGKAEPLTDQSYLNLKVKS